MNGTYPKVTVIHSVARFNETSSSGQMACLSQILFFLLSIENFCFNIENNKNIRRDENKNFLIFEEYYNSCFIPAFFLVEPFNSFRPKDCHLQNLCLLTIIIFNIVNKFCPDCLGTHRFRIVHFCLWLNFIFKDFG